MFDLRYHVASLTAVFLALVIGILVGVGIADRGLVDRAKKSLLEQRVAQLQTQLDHASQKSALSDREQKAAQLYVNETYPVLVRNRLKGKRIAVVFVGSVDGKMRSDISQALTDAGAQQVRLRALKMPIDAATVDARLASQSDDKGYLGKGKLENLGKALGQELVNGGDTPLWDALTDTLVEEQFGGGKEPVDGVVVARTVPPQRAGTSRFLLGLYKGLNSSGLPAVGVETTDAAHSAVAVFRRAGLSSVDDIDTPAGRLSVVLLLAGSQPGQYGLKSTAKQSFPPFPIAARTGG
ncbi:MAG TPA: copper transporter [Gaiellaceae bacterium]|nr:copper transporter [Gaiellaceae bacterium]